MYLFFNYIYENVITLASIVKLMERISVYHVAIWKLLLEIKIFNNASVSKVIMIMPP